MAVTWYRARTRAPLQFSRWIRRCQPRSGSCLTAATWSSRRLPAAAWPRCISPRHPAGPNRRAQDRPSGAGPRPGVRRPVHQRGAVGGPAVQPERGRRLRPGLNRRPALHRDGVRAGPDLRELLVARGRLSPREALDIIERVLAGLAGRPRRRHHPPGRQARERAARQRDVGQGRRLRPGQGGRRRQQHQDRAADRHCRLPGARAGSRQRLGPAHRRLRRRRDAVRDADWRAAAHRRDRRWRSPTST